MIDVNSNISVEMPMVHVFGSLVKYLMARGEILPDKIKSVVISLGFEQKENGLNLIIESIVANNQAEEQVVVTAPVESVETVQ